MPTRNMEAEAAFQAQRRREREDEVYEASILEQMDEEDFEDELERQREEGYLLRSRPKICCADCNLDHYKDDIPEGQVNAEDEIVCDLCWKKYRRCYKCNDVHTKDDSLSGPDGNYYCEDCWNDIFTFCNRCEEVFRWNSTRTDRRGHTLCEFCYDDYAYKLPEWNVYTHDIVLSECNQFINPDRDHYSRDTFNLIPSSRYVGVEIETNFASQIDSDDVFYNCEEYIRNSRHDVPEEDRFRTGIDVVEDGSITSSNHRNGYEVVMVPRRGDMIYKDVQNVVSGLKGYCEAYTSYRCGLHIHVDIRDFDWYHFAVLGIMTKLIEPHIYTWVPESRRTGVDGQNWCRPVSQTLYDFGHVVGRDDFVDCWYDNGGYSTNKYNEKRYHGLNLHSHFQANQGVEIRYHGGTLNADKVMHWSIFWTNVIDHCYDLAETLYRESTIVSRKDKYFKLSETSLLSSLFLSSNVDKKLKTLEKRWLGRSVTNILQYKRDSEWLRKALDLDKRERPYMIEPMLSHFRYRQNLSVMSIDNIFDTFDIPDKTRRFFKDRVIEIKNNGSTSPEHFKECFSNVSTIVEFNRKKMSFEYKDSLEAQFPTLGDDLVRDEGNLYYLDRVHSSLRFMTLSDNYML